MNSYNVWGYYYDKRTDTKTRRVVKGYPIEIDEEQCWVCRDPRSKRNEWMVIENNTGLTLTGVSCSTMKDAEASARDRVKRFVTDHGKRLKDIVEGSGTKVIDLPEWRE